MYCTSFCRAMTAMSSAGPSARQMLTVKTRPLRRGLMSNTASTGVFERMPPSQ